jgi:hypothetical protein
VHPQVVARGAGHVVRDRSGLGHLLRGGRHGRRFPSVVVAYALVRQW